jgi:putative hemolysin
MKMEDRNTTAGPGFFRRIAQRVTGLNQLLSIYDLLESTQDVEAFLEEGLSLLKIRMRVREKDWERITSSGPTVVVANHPFGALDGVLLAKMLLQVRKDVRFLANPILERIPELRDLFFFVDPYLDRVSMRKNVLGTLNAVRWLKNGGMLCVFPAGEVAHSRWHRWKPVEAVWRSSITRIVLATGATVVPAFVCGSNGPLFQLAGLIHPKLRTALLPRELLNKRGKEVEIRVGKPIPAFKLPTELRDHEIAAYLRFRTELLAQRSRPERRRVPSRRTIFARPAERIASHEGTHLLAEEIDSLPPGQALVRTAQQVVKFAYAEQAPRLLREIGRLREKTFRRIGEGTGKARDLDEFDAHYIQLFLWNQERREIVGAYRIGKTDEILAKFGVSGLYTSRLFHYGKEFTDSISPGLELGRSFIRPKYQKGVSALALLWKGIGIFVHRNPRYRYLFGPVSVSNDYCGLSRSFLVDFMKARNFDEELARSVKGRNPYGGKRPRENPHTAGFSALLREMDDLSDVISDVEPEFEGPPVLIRQYVRLGGRFIAFNVDREFSDCLDGLIRVDLLAANAKMIQSYMGREEYEAFLRFHGVTESSRVSANVN